MDDRPTDSKQTERGLARRLRAALSRAWGWLTDVGRDQVDDALGPQQREGRR